LLITKLQLVATRQLIIFIQILFSTLLRCLLFIFMTEVMHNL